MGVAMKRSDAAVRLGVLMAIYGRASMYGRSLCSGGFADHTLGLYGNVNIVEIESHEDGPLRLKLHEGDSSVTATVQSDAEAIWPLAAHFLDGESIEVALGTLMRLGPSTPVEPPETRLTGESPTRDEVPGIGEPKP